MSWFFSSDNKMTFQSLELQLVPVYNLQHRYIVHPKEKNYQLWYEIESYIFLLT